MGTLFRWAGAAGIAALLVFACGGGGGGGGTNDDAGPGDDQPSDGGLGSDAGGGDGAQEAGLPPMQCGTPQALFDAPDAGDAVDFTAFGFAAMGSKFLAGFHTTSYHLRARAYDGTTEGPLLMPLGADGTTNASLWENGYLGGMPIRVSASGKGFLQFRGFDGSNSVVVRVPVDVGAGTTGTLTTTVSDGDFPDLVALPNDEALSAYLVGSTVHVDHYAAGTWTPTSLTYDISQAKNEPQAIFAINAQGKGALVLSVNANPARVVLAPFDGSTFGTPFDWYQSASGLTFLEAQADAKGDVYATFGEGSKVQLLHHVAGTTGAGTPEEVVIPVPNPGSNLPFLVDAKGRIVVLYTGAGNAYVAAAQKVGSSPWVQAQGDVPLAKASSFAGRLASDSQGNVFALGVKNAVDLQVLRLPANDNEFEKPVSTNVKVAGTQYSNSVLYVDGSDRVVILTNYPSKASFLNGLAYVICK